MPDSTPTPGEIMRRLDEVVKRFEDVSKDVREFRSWAERLYVPRGEWVEGRRADMARIGAVEQDVQEIRNDNTANVGYRRQFTIALVVVALSSLASLVIALLMLFLSGGKP